MIRDVIDISCTSYVKFGGPDDLSVCSNSNVLDINWVNIRK